MINFRIVALRSIYGNHSRLLVSGQEHFFENSEYDQEIPQSQTADKSVALRGRVTQQSQDT